MNFHITNHCKDRYLERVLNGKNICNNMLFRILSDLNTSSNITSKISVECPRFILYLKEKYGNKRGYTLLKKDHTLFILTKRKGTEQLYDVVTCYIENDILKQFKTVLSKQEVNLKLSLIKNKQ